MNINKAHWQTKDQSIRLSMPINKVDKERRMVHGFATLDNLDKQGDVVPADASVKAFERFRGNLREMHQPIAVGKVVSFKEDKYFDTDSNKFYNGVYVSAYVSKGAQDTWEKVLDGTLTGFSIGGEIHETEDVYDEDMGKAYQVIKEYSLSELSLVDNPANQFANVISVEKMHGENHAEGYLAKASIENVYWCRKDDIVQMSIEDKKDCPQCDKAMSNIGFVESNDKEKADVIKSMISSIKEDEIYKGIKEGSFVKFDDGYGKVVQIVSKGGVRFSSGQDAVMAKSDDPVVIIKGYSQNDSIIVPSNFRVIKYISSLEKVNAISKSEVKEVSKMDSNVIVVDEIEKSDVIEPEATSLPVTESDSTVAETTKAEEPEVEKAENTEEKDETEKAEEPEVEKSDDEMEDEEEEEAMKADTPTEDAEVTAKMVGDITETLSSALSTLAETVKALDAKIEGINKAVAGVAGKVEDVEDKFGKRVDAVEKDTAFRKSADLGEILQEEPVEIMEKSTWGGRFLTNADLFK
jgi:rubrerythrin